MKIITALSAALILMFLSPGCQNMNDEDDTEKNKKSEDGGKNEASGTDAGTDAGTDNVLDWVFIEGGTFEMGWEDTAASENDERPVHEVTVKDFYIARTEVTLAQYELCIEASVCTGPLFEHWRCNMGIAYREDHPMNCINWEQAGQFCEWAGGRLPTEAEWEFAARSRGQKRMYPWGDEHGTCDYATMSTLELGEGCGEETTWPVCSRPDGNTEQDLCDMAGNVNEWCMDWYHKNYEGAPDDGSAWQLPEGSKRIVRGGSVFTETYALRTTSRFSKFPLRPPENYVKGTLGFRCVR